MRLYNNNDNYSDSNTNNKNLYSQIRKEEFKQLSYLCLYMSKAIKTCMYTSLPVFYK